MRLFTPRRIVALVALAPALFLFGAVPGCSNQSEGERCGDDLAPNNDDCTAPLVCTIIEGSSHNYRCCNPSRNVVNDSRCIASNTASGGSGGSATAGSGGSGDSGTAGSSGSGGSATAGSGGSAGGSDLGGTGGIDASTAGMSSGGI